MVESKQRLNQLIIKASKDNALRNFSLVEKERDGSLDRLFEKYQNQRQQRQSQIFDEHERLQRKIKQEVA